MGAQLISMSFSGNEYSVENEVNRNHSNDVTKDYTLKKYPCMEKNERD